MTTTSVTTHPDYGVMLPAIKAVRTACKGGYFIKRGGYKFLAHPSDVDQTSPAALARYSAYALNAEFDEIPQQTLRSYLGRMRFNDAEFEMPSQLEYLIQNADNDGTALTGMIEQAANNIMQVGFHILVAEYVNAPAAGEVLSEEQARQRNIRAAIKSYVRESLLDWSYARINGVLQLSYLKFLETRSELDAISGTRKDVKEYFVMAIDEEGAYYWQKFDGESTTQQMAQRNYVTVGGQALRWLPVEIVTDMEQDPGKLPMQLGILAPIVDKVLARYRTSANYKECLKHIAPTSWTAGWTQHGYELFQQMNGGSDQMKTGPLAMLNLPEGVEAGVINPSMSFEGYENYFERNKDEITALGGVWPSNDGQGSKTATQADNEASEVNSRLQTLADNLENAFERLIVYCGMFAGMWAKDAIEQNLNQVIISLPREFARTKMTPQEQQAVRDNMLAGIYGKAEAVRILVKGGVTVSDAETILAEVDEGA